METMTDIIRNEDESNWLDFKKEFYRNKVDLIKDVMAFANSNVDRDRYIVFGVKLLANGERTFHNIEYDKLLDSASYLQLIHNKIEPDVSIDFFQYSLDGIDLFVIRIFDCCDGPYLCKSGFSDSYVGGKSTSIDKGEGFIRTGSSTRRLCRSDFEKIYSARYKESDRLELDIQFSNSEEDSIEIFIKEPPEYPSIKKRQRLHKFLEERKGEPKGDIFRPFTSLRGLLTPGSDEYFRGMSESDLLLEISRLSATPTKDDQLYIMRECCVGINFVALNGGTNYLEDASVQLKFPDLEGFAVLYKDVRSDFSVNFHYPIVKLKESSWFVSQGLGDLKHGLPTLAFRTELVLLPFPVLRGTAIDIECKIFGKQLKEPYCKTLNIHFK